VRVTIVRATDDGDGEITLTLRVPKNQQPEVLNDDDEVIEVNDFQLSTAKTPLLELAGAENVAELVGRDVDCTAMDRSSFFILGFMPYIESIFNFFNVK